MGQNESQPATMTSTFDPKEVEQSKVDLLHLFGINQEIFGELCKNTAEITSEMRNTTPTIAKRIKPFFTEDLVVSMRKFNLKRKN